MNINRNIMISWAILQTIMMICASVGFADDCPQKETISPCKCYKPRHQIVVKCKNIKDFNKIKTKLVSNLPDKQLISLQLFHLKMKHIPEGFVDGLKLNYLSIIHSHVETIDLNAFRNNEKSLIYLYISNSNLKSIFNPVLKKLTSLHEFGIYENGDMASTLITITKSDTDNLPDSIQSLMLDKNGIEEIDTGAFTRFKALTQLYLRSNNLTMLKENVLPTSLQILDITSNVFRAIPMKAISSVTKDLDIWMTVNNVKNIPNKTDMFNLFKKGFKFNLNNNPLMCTCKDKWIAEYNKQSSKYLLLGQCNGGDKVRQYIHLDDLTADHFSDC